MNVLLRVIKTLHKPPKSLSETRLSKASSELSELMDVGFKLDWLKSKLEEVYLERKKPNVDGSKVQQLEEHVKELGLKLDSLNAKLDEVSLERKKGDDTNESRAKQVEKRVNNLGMMELELRLKLDSLNEKLDVVSLERKKADDTIESRAKQVEKRVKDLALMDLGFNKRLNTMLGDWERKKSHETSVFASRIEQMEEHVMGLGFKLDSLDTKLEEISKERKKADSCLVQKHEESVKNIEIMVSHLKAELDKKKDKTSDDGFLLVD
ncbi:TRAF-like family protein [Raphanus sativus]|nr:TRAF-like family protein [Raphanus sativus]